MSRIRIDIIGNPSSALRAFRTTGREAQVFGSRVRRSSLEMGQFTRGTIAGSGALRGLGRSVAFASGAFLGGAGLIHLLRQSKDEYRDLIEATNKTDVTFKASARSVKAFAKDALGLSQKQALETASSYGSLLRPMGLLPKEAAKNSIAMTKLGVDLASFKNTGTEEALDAISSGLVGQVRPLRRYGAELSAARVEQVALTQTGKDSARDLTRREKVLARITLLFRDTVDAQGDYRRTIGDLANQERELTKNIANTEAILGKALYPTLLKATKAANEWLGSQENQAEIGRAADSVLGDITASLKGVVGGLKLIKEAGAPVIDAIGGMENAVKALTVLWVGMKVKALVGFGATATASSLTRTKVIADAAAMELALDAATRPRFIPITVLGGIPGTIAPYGTGKTGKMTRTPKPQVPKSGSTSFLGRAVRYIGGSFAAGGAFRVGAKVLATGAGAGASLTAATVLAVLMSAGAGSRLGDRSKKYRRVYRAVARAVAGTATPAELAILNRTLGKYSLENAPEKVMKQAEAALKKNAKLDSNQAWKDRATFTPQAPAGGGQEVGPGGGGGKGTSFGRRTLPLVERELARARAFGDEPGTKRLLQEERGIMRRQIASLEKRGELGKKEQAHLDQLYGDLAGVNAELEAIAAAALTGAKSQSKKTSDAHEKAAQAAQDAADKIKEAWQNARIQAGQAFGELLRGPLLGGSYGDFIREYGQMGATVDPGTILQDIQMQNKQTEALIGNLQKIKGRGAPTGFMNELRAMGPEGAAFIASIANAPKLIFEAIVDAFKVRQADLQKASIFINANNVVVRTGGKDIPHGLASGGTVPGSGRGDTVPAMLTPGELVLNKGQQSGLARAIGMPGAGPQALFGAVQKFAGGGVAQKFGLGGVIGGLKDRILGGARRFGRWAKTDPWGAGMLKKLYGYLNHQSSEFLRAFIPTRESVRVMGSLFKDIGLGYVAPSAWYSKQGAAARGRANPMLGAMAMEFVHALRDPVANAGFLASFLVPGPKGLSAMTKTTRVSQADKSLAAFKAKLVAAEFHPADVPMQEANLRLKREPHPTKGSAARKPPFDKRVGNIAARQILGSFREKDLAHVLPENVRSVGDVTQLMGDLYNSALQGLSRKLWYEKSSKEILDFAGGDKVKARKVAGIAAVYSPRRSVEESVKRAIIAYEAWERTKTVPRKGELSRAETRKAQGILDGTRMNVGGRASGRKIQNFYLDLMQEIDAPWAAQQRMAKGGVGQLGSTMDVWMERAFGYRPKRKLLTGKYGNPGPGTRQYDFMDMVNAAVASQLGISNKQAQAAIWSTTKARWEKRSISKAGTTIGDYLKGQSTQINYEALFGDFGQRLKDKLGPQAASDFSRQAFEIVNPGGRSRLLEIFGLLGKHGGMQQGVFNDPKWGIDLNPGAHDLVAAPRLADNKVRKQGYKILPQFHDRVREYQAGIGTVYRQQSVGSATVFPMETSAGKVNPKIRAGRNSAWLARKFNDLELAAVSKKLGAAMLMLPRAGGWIIKPASNKSTFSKWFPKLKEQLDVPALEEMTVTTGLVKSGQYKGLLSKAEKRKPGTIAQLLSLQKELDQLVAQFEKKMSAGAVRKAGGGVIPGSGRGDNVPAMLTPGELVLNQKQQGGVARALGLGRVSGQRLFGEISRFAHGGMVLSGRQRSQSSFLPSSSPPLTPAPSFEQHNTITVPPQFADTEWAIERGLQRATWRLKKGV